MASEEQVLSELGSGSRLLVSQTRPAKLLVLAKFRALMIRHIGNWPILQ